MGTSTYRELLAIGAVRRILVMSTLIRIPLWAAGVVLVLHVVGHLDRSYAAAGLVETVYAGALALSNPWRGRRLDRVGLRRTVAPSLVVLTVCWSIGPWLPYPLLLPLVAVAGLFTVPQFSIVRLVLIGAAGARRRTAALSIDSVMIEVSFMIGPVLGVLAATVLPTPWALLICQGLAILGAAWLWFDNPSLADQEAEPDAAPLASPLTSPRTRLGLPAWASAAAVGVLLVAVAATVILTAEDLGTVAALRSMHHTGSIGWVLALWGLSSAIGGILYGALPRHPPSYVLIVLLAVTTAAVAATNRLGGEMAVFVALLFVSGFFCAPTITATVDDLTGLVATSSRGEAMGWHGSAMTMGGALGAPVAGVAIDATGWPGAFLAGAAVGVVIAALAWLAARASPPPTSPPPTSGSAASDAVAVGGLGHRGRDGGTDALVEG